MASQTKRSRPQRIRLRIEAECETEAARDALAIRLSHVRELLTPPGSRRMDNETLLNSMFDIVEKTVQRSESRQTTLAAQPLTQSFMRNSGKT